MEELLSLLNQISNAPPPNLFLHLTSSFSTPTAREVIAIKDAIGNRQEEFIEKIFSRLKDVEKTLQARLDAERDHKARLRGMLSTIRSLPPEVLSNIFILCSPDEVDNYSRSTLNRLLPWSISRVSQMAIRLSRDAPAMGTHSDHQSKPRVQIWVPRTAQDCYGPFVSTRHSASATGH